MDTVLKETGLPPHMLELEVTESMALQSVASTLATLHACKALGVAFVAFSPLARGMLGDRSLRLDQVQDGFRSSNPRFTEPNLTHNLIAVRGFEALAFRWGGR